MRNVFPVICASLLLSGCSVFGGEHVQKDYVGPASLNEQQVTHLLTQQGYTNITGLHKNGTDWIGAATDPAGQQVNFDIDKGGTVHTR